MSDAAYLDAVLHEQNLEEGSGQLRELQRHREEVEKLLRKKFGLGPTIRYGGSKAKGTMIRDSYDLDLTCYFPENDTNAGDTLEKIYESVETALREQYWTERKGSAIRLRSRDELRTDFHIDVVPGRFVDGDSGDVHLYRTGGDKHYLKTNLDVHIAHVRDSKVVPAIRLVKLWACRNHLGIKTFALELLTIKLLDGRKALELSAQLRHVLMLFRDEAKDLCIEDPANRYGNDLSELLNEGMRIALEMTARSTLDQLEQSGWEAVFGPLKETEKAKKVAALKRMAAAAPVRPKPYGIN